MTRRSLAGRLLLWLLPSMAVAIGLPLLLHRWLDDDRLAFLLSALIVLPLVMLAVRRALAPMNSLFRALSGSVNSYRDGEYNFGIHWDSPDELGALVASHSELGDVLREQRQSLVQRELLLDTMVQNTPVAMLLLATGGDGVRRVVFANVAARKLLHGGWKLEGQNFDLLLESAPVEMREALSRGGDSLFAVAQADSEEEEQVYHLARRYFRLNGRRHELLLLRLLTSELRRQEVMTWKKVIRVISHELNNSLAPIASLAHSGSELIRRGRHDRLEEIFATIEDRARHLEGFIRGYARFAKLPQPQLQTIHWNTWLEGLRRQITFQLEMPADDLSSRIDPAQLEQALLNLLKNAHESGSSVDGVAMKVTRLPDWIRLEVMDRGSGMNDAVLQNALVPFYSTKRNGTGLGLALTREIVEAHGGRLSLHNREGGGLCVAIQLPDNPGA
ncbi:MULTISPECIES: HAMP domain-containing sensor histidine kinase [Pseudoxanthomonas]|uniref:sensor histidine kinase n=1 Tax=Pseudoxanthomonas TaxID=83618 RepID=UPI0016077BEC|nr:MULTISPECIES: HAMP domain-containing sensor histidine kinase [Pseudoxanthomonas]MBB3276672.1 nitrogen fixation/metabolism regulation signal transduction histidine kinase [Pseudoxanthomonas sp. OG2]MBD9378736.1 HAMP domain-containing histidine kinase [Pseudoxanthomonas sp. PXM04]MBV7472254.1 HAMP domain-containing histidine kinase [Pseudoxanthomonas sp. PXM05]UBB25516.1 HAMP domain-containing histidine kinase [Pseudoxanthomonas japonensis]